MKGHPPKDWIFNSTLDIINIIFFSRSLWSSQGHDTDKPDVDDKIANTPRSLDESHTTMGPKLKLQNSLQNKSSQSWTSPSTWTPTMSSWKDSNGNRFVNVLLRLLYEQLASIAMPLVAASQTEVNMQKREDLNIHVAITLRTSSGIYVRGTSGIVQIVLRDSVVAWLLPIFHSSLIIRLTNYMHAESVLTLMSIRIPEPVNKVIQVILLPTASIQAMQWNASKSATLISGS